jgi:hypothetical protein
MKQILTMMNSGKIGEGIKVGRLCPLSKTGSQTVTPNDIKTIGINSHVMKVIKKTMLKELIANNAGLQSHADW